MQPTNIFCIFTSNAHSCTRSSMSVWLWWCGSQETWLWRLDTEAVWMPLYFGSCVQSTLFIAPFWKYGIIGLGVFLGHTIHVPKVAVPRSPMVLFACFVNASFGVTYLVLHHPLCPSQLAAGTLTQAFVLVSCHYCLFDRDALPCRRIAYRFLLLHKPIIFLLKTIILF
jgi:hypothetical protein